MPLYEYQCASCKKIHEVMAKFSDAPLTACPDCQGPVSKLVSMGSFALKGTGWYTTDYKRKSGPVEAPAAAASTATPAPAASGSSSAPSSSASGSAAPVSTAAATPVAAPKAVTAGGKN